MKKQDRQGVRTPAGLERKYAIGQSFKKAQGGIEKAAEDAGVAKEQAQSANVGLEKVEKSAQEAKRLAKEASESAAAAKSAVDGIALTVENGQTTAKIVLKVGDTEIPATIDMKGLASVLALQTAGGVDINGANITGMVELTGERDEEGSCLKVKLSPEGLQARLMEEDEAAEEVESARAELSTMTLRLQGKYAGFEVTRTEGQEDAETGETTGQGVTVKVEDFLAGVALQLLVHSGKVRISGLTEPEGESDAVNKAYMDREMAKLREELGLNNS